MSDNGKPTCVIPGCTRRLAIRGLCRACYLSALAAIKAGTTSWHELERAGLVAAKVPRSDQGAFTKALAALKQEETV